MLKVTTSDIIITLSKRVRRVWENDCPEVQVEITIIRVVTQVGALGRQRPHQHLQELEVPHRQWLLSLVVWYITLSILRLLDMGWLLNLLLLTIISGGLPLFLSIGVLELLSFIIHLLTIRGIFLIIHRHRRITERLRRLTNFILHTIFPTSITYNIGRRSLERRMEVEVSSTVGSFEEWLTDKTITGISLIFFQGLSSAHWLLNRHHFVRDRNEM